MDNTSDVAAILSPLTNDEALLGRYEEVRSLSERLYRPLELDDHQLQSIAETGPPKWPLAHVSWFI